MDPQTPATAAPWTPAAYIAFLVEYMCSVVDIVGPRHRLTETLTGLIQARIRRLGRQFARLIERLRTGAPAPVRPTTTAIPASPRRAQPRRPAALPRHHRWLVHFIPELDFSTGTLEWLIEQPETKALIAQSPEVGRILRPLCRMLGVYLPSCLLLPRRPRVRTPPPPPPEPAPGPPAGDGMWPQWRGPGLLWHNEQEFWKFHPPPRGDPPERE